MITGDEGVQKAASGILCNLLLEFSPSKEPLLDKGASSLLGRFTMSSDPTLRLNGVWALTVQFLFYFVHYKAHSVLLFKVFKMYLTKL
jgi:hypothetical protein